MMLTRHTRDKPFLAESALPTPSTRLAVPWRIHAQVLLDELLLGHVQAQRRFRERQKSLIGDLRESVSTLTRETEAQSKQIFVLQVRIEKAARATNTRSAVHASPRDGSNPSRDGSNPPLLV